MSCGNNCSCHGNESSKAEGSRRNFLKSSVSSLTTGFIGGPLLNSMAFCKDTITPCSEKINVLTLDGQLISVNKSDVADFSRIQFWSKKYHRFHNTPPGSAFTNNQWETINTQMKLQSMVTYAEAKKLRVLMQAEV